MKRIIPILMIMCIIFTGCGSKSDFAESSSGTSYDMITQDKLGDVSNENAGISSDTGSQKGEGSSSSNNANSGSGDEVNKKIIKNAEVDMTAKDVNECYDKILKYVENLNGYEFSKNMSTSSDYVTINSQIKISPENLQNALDYFSECGKVINSSTSTNDITTQYIDVQIRLENKKKNLEKYYEYYQKAATMEEALMLQDKIDALTAEIESYEGQLSYWNSLVSESTITLHIQQENDPVKIKKDIKWNSLNFKEMGKLIYNGFVSVVNVIVSVIQWIIIILLSISPLLIIAAIVAFIIIKQNKKKKLKKLNGKPDTEKSDPENNQTN